MQTFVSTLLLSFFSLLVLFILTKIMGYRQISQLSAFDYINGITIGSIAAEMAIADSKNFLRPLLAMIFYGLAVFLVSVISSKTIHLRRFLVGKPYILMENGQISRENLSKSKIDINEFLTQLRVNGYFELAEIETVLLEPDGRFSILPKAQFKSLTPRDMDICVNNSSIPALIIIDGNIMINNLKKAGFDENWLTKKLAEKNIKAASDVFLATVDVSGSLNTYLMQNTIPKDTNLI